MADYSNFPFGDFTVAEVFALARESKEIGDDEFVKACMEAIRLNKCAAQQGHEADAASLSSAENTWRVASGASS